MNSATRCVHCIYSCYRDSKPAEDDASSVSDVDESRSETSDIGTFNGDKAANSALIAKEPYHQFSRSLIQVHIDDWPAAIPDSNLSMSVVNQIACIQDQSVDTVTRLTWERLGSRRRRSHVVLDLTGDEPKELEASQSVVNESQWLKRCKSASSARGGYCMRCGSEEHAMMECLGSSSTFLDRE